MNTKEKIERKKETEYLKSESKRFIDEIRSDTGYGLQAANMIYGFTRRLFEIQKGGAK